MEGIGKYFFKKRDLSDQSQGDHERKKVKEGSSTNSTDNTDVFGDGLESADCKAILFNCLKDLGVKVNEVVINKIKSEMDLDISPGDIDRTHRIGVPTKGKNTPIIVKLFRYIDRRYVFTNKKRLKGKNMSITESLTKIRMSALKEARNKFGFSSVWTANGKIVQRRR